MYWKVMDIVALKVNDNLMRKGSVSAAIAILMSDQPYAIENIAVTVRKTDA